MGKGRTGFEATKTRYRGKRGRKKYLWAHYGFLNADWRRLPQCLHNGQSRWVYAHPSIEYGKSLLIVFDEARRQSYHLQETKRRKGKIGDWPTLLAPAIVSQGEKE
jgi:hypothetical protein